MNLIIHTDAEGKLTNRAALAEKFKKLKPNSSYSIAFRDTKKRSSSQNAYLHGVVLPLVLEGLRHNGYDEVEDIEGAKLILRTLFLKRTISNGVNDIEIIKSTSELTTIEFSDFIERVAKWCAEYLSFALPMLNQQTELQY